MITCWLCGKETNIKDTDYGEHRCNFCKVLIDVFDPNHPDWLPPEGYKEEEMKPPKRQSKDFEKVVIGEMIQGVIEDIKYDQEHKFPGFQGAEDTIQPAVRFKFALEGYSFPHYSRWYKFNYGQKANLYKIFISKLVENAEPDLDFDLDLLKGMKVKTLWNENGDFQNLESIFPAGAKVKASDPMPQIQNPDEPADEDLVVEEPQEPPEEDMQ